MNIHSLLLLIVGIDIGHGDAMLKRHCKKSDAVFTCKDI